MPDLLALEFESNKILGVEAGVSASSVRINSCFELAIPENVDFAESPAEAGAWLKDQLAERQVQTTQVLVTFPREIAVVRHIEMPDVADEELPDLVKYQASLKSALPMDQLALDFLPLPKSEEATARDVLIATVPRQAIRQVTAVAAAAGLEITAAGLSPVSAAEVVLRSKSGETSDEGASLIVTRHGPRVEISLLKGEHIVFSHFTQVAGDANGAGHQAVISAVARSLMGLTGPVQSRDITRACLLGSEEEFAALAPALQTRVTQNVQIIDPFEIPGVKTQATLPANRSAYSALVGSLAAHAEPLAAPINFLDPRKPPVKPDHTRRRVIIGAVAAACLAVVVGGTMYVKINNLDRRIKDLQEEKKRVAEFIEHGQPLLEKTAMINEWTGDRRLWLDELVALRKHLPEPDRAFFNHIQADMGTGKAPAKITLKGYSREEGDVREFSESVWSRGNRYKLDDYDSAPDNKDPYHPWRFDAGLLLNTDTPAVDLTAAVSTPKTEKPETTPAAPAGDVKPDGAKPDGAKPDDAKADDGDTAAKTEGQPS